METVKTYKLGTGRTIAHICGEPITDETVVGFNELTKHVRDIVKNFFIGETGVIENVKITRIS